MLPLLTSKNGHSRRNQYTKEIRILKVTFESDVDESCKNIFLFDEEALERILNV